MIVGIIMIAGFIISGRLYLDSPLFSDPYSTVLFDRQQNLLGARTASDGQWRFPETDSIPEKYENCRLRCVYISLDHLIPFDYFTVSGESRRVWLRLLVYACHIS